MDTYNPSKLTAAPKKVDISLRQLADFDQTGGDRDRVDNVRDNQVLVSLSNINRPKTFSFRYISDLLIGGTGVTISTDKDGITTISATGGGGSALIYRHEFNVYDYLGTAPTGSLEASNVWDITRLTIASNGSVTTGVATNVSWTGRYTHTYL